MKVLEEFDLVVVGYQKLDADQDNVIIFENYSFKVKKSLKIDG
jgi:hypothetical protein